jgi:hypothetical protein
MVFSPGGDLVASLRGVVSASAQVEIEEGEYTVAVVANPHRSLAGITTLSALEAEVVSLASQSLAGGVTMFGSAAAEVGPQGGSAYVELERLLARVRLDKVSIDASSRPVLASKTVRIESVYLINAVGSAGLCADGQPSQWFNRMHWEASEADALAKDEIGHVLTSASPYQKVHCLYAFTNTTSEDSTSDSWSPRYTRLVLECSVDGEPYYYSVDLPGMARNHEYRITSLVIKDWGSKDPDKNVEASIEVEFFTSLEWDEEYNIEEIS